jgi:hypothetical protein
VEGERLISCATFRATVRPGSDDASVLEHLRSCDACLDYALSIDPDFFFRANGGGELVPPGGVDNFVNDVMAQVRSRQTESTTGAMRRSLNWYLRTAAAVLLVVTGATGILRYTSGGGQPSPTVRIAAANPTLSIPTTTKQIVETYESKDATIVEVPAAKAGDAKVVMIYDESLPADL